MDPLFDDQTVAAVRSVREQVAALADRLILVSQPAVEAWKVAVDTRLLPRLLPSFPLVAAICGGGSSGKSTLFNTLVGDPVSPTGGRAGINRRLLVSMHPGCRRTPGLLEALFEPLGGPPQPLTHPEVLTTPGEPLLHEASGLPPGLVLVDTPDFDTGARGSYQNREQVERALGAADLLIYIFTNANYNNRDNTDFIARMLTAVGTRKCFLVYRVYPGFEEGEVRDHAGTVARHLYGETGWREHVLGVYRAGEDNRVADGGQPMALRPVAGTRLDLLAHLAGMDPRQVRAELHRSVFRDAIDQGRRFLKESRLSTGHLKLYLQGLRAVQQASVRGALGRLPMDAVVRRFSEIWQATDPTHIKIMRRTGRVVETPVRLLLRAARWVGRTGGGQTGLPTDQEAGAAMAADLVAAANRLRQAAIDPTLTLTLEPGDPAVGPLRDTIGELDGATGATVRRSDAGGVTFQLPLHPALAATQAGLRQANWAATVDDLLGRQESLLGLTRQLEADLQRLVSEQRGRLTALDQLRQTFSAMLNIIPATAAVTYILHTGDPVGAAGIKVKLAGLFGLNDLYALVAIPATAGMKKADLKQLEALLGPVAQAWLTHKLTAVERLFEEKITGALLRHGAGVLDAVAAPVARLEQGLARCARVLEEEP